MRIDRHAPGHKTDTSRRAAYISISSRFRPRGCAAHGPSAERPGAIANQLRANFATLGESLDTNGRDPAIPAVIEYRPHIALPALLHREHHLPYKVSRSDQMLANLRHEQIEHQFRAIKAGRKEQINGILHVIPEPSKVSTLASLKPVEDMLDGLIFAWIGMSTTKAGPLVCGTTPTRSGCRNSFEAPGHLRVIWHNSIEL